VKGRIRDWRDWEMEDGEWRMKNERIIREQNWSPIR
jgi:hypothetical protein